MQPLTSYASTSNDNNQKIERITDEGAKYDAWLGIMTASLIAQNYTENGWGLTRAPEHITKRLQERLHSTLDTVEMACDSDGGNCRFEEGERLVPAKHKGARKEHFVNVIEAEDHARPVMISDYRDNDAILDEMKPMFEWWSGQELVGSTAYGIRAYRNDSNLLMHVDRPDTHVIR
jgi:hypothetical protein